jgi:quercetin dioxygenase-like cupin family protein
MSLPTVRRIVTGHTPSGDAIIESDKELVPYDPRSPDSSPGSLDTLAFTTVWRTDAFPARTQGPWEELNGKPIPLNDTVGTTLRIVDFPPGPGVMHRTVSLDFGIVLSGEIYLELDNGVETKVEKHGIAIQRGTIHAWENRSNEPCRMLFVLTPAEKVKVGDGELEATGIPKGIPS